MLRLPLPYPLPKNCVITEYRKSSCEEKSIRISVYARFVLQRCVLAASDSVHADFNIVEFQKLDELPMVY